MLINYDTLVPYWHEVLSYLAVLRKFGGLLGMAADAVMIKLGCVKPSLQCFLFFTFPNVFIQLYWVNFCAQTVPEYLARKNYKFRILVSCNIINFSSSYAGTKFFVVAEPGTQNMDSLLKHIYEQYTDYVLKNPFYEMEMPIRCELFDVNLSQAVQKDRVAFLG